MEGMDGGSFTMSFNSSQPRGHNAAAVAVSDDGLIKFSNYNNIIIVEDDITINHIFKNELQSFFELKLEKWDVLLLGGSYINSKPYKNNIHKLVSATTTKGYVVSKHYYKTLLNCFMEAYNKINEEMDDKLNFTNHTKYAIDQHCGGKDQQI